MKPASVIFAAIVLSLSEGPIGTTSIVSACSTCHTSRSLLRQAHNEKATTPQNITKTTQLKENKDAKAGNTNGSFEKNLNIQQIPIPIPVPVQVDVPQLVPFPIQEPPVVISAGPIPIPIPVGVPVGPVGPVVFPTPAPTTSAMLNTPLIQMIEQDMTPITRPIAQEGPRGRLTSRDNNVVANGLGGMIHLVNQRPGRNHARTFDTFETIDTGIPAQVRRPFSRLDFSGELRRGLKTPIADIQFETERLPFNEGVHGFSTGLMESRRRMRNSLEMEATRHRASLQPFNLVVARPASTLQPRRR